MYTVNDSWMMFPQPFRTALVSLGLLLCHPNFSWSYHSICSLQCCSQFCKDLVYYLVSPGWRMEHKPALSVSSDQPHIWCRKERYWISCLGPYSPLLSAFSGETQPWRDGLSSLTLGYLFPLGFCNITININRTKEKKIWKFWAQNQTNSCRIHKIQMCKQKK